MSKRAKFTLITWIGENISGLQRAKISTDKAMVKEIVQVRESELLHVQRVAIKIMVVIMRVKQSGALIVRFGKLVVTDATGNQTLKTARQIGFLKTTNYLSMI